jgi:hypothetical protein
LYECSSEVPCASVLVKSGLANRDYGLGDPPYRPCHTRLSAKLALTSPTSGGRSVGIVRSRTKVTELLTSARSQSDELNEVVTVLTYSCIWEDPGSNIGRVTDYPGRSLSWFLLSLSRQMLRGPLPCVRCYQTVLQYTCISGIDECH